MKMLNRNNQTKNLENTRISFLKNGFWLVIIKGISLPVSILVNGLLARILNPKELGIYFLALSIISILVVISSFGLNKILVREVALNSSSGQKSELLSAVITIFTMLIVGMFITGIIYIFTDSVIFKSILNSSLLIEYRYYIVGLFCFLAIQAMLSDGFRGLNKIRLASIFASGGTNFGLLNKILLLSYLIFAIKFLSGVDLRNIFTVILLVTLITILFAIWLFQSNIKMALEMNDPGPLLIDVRSEKLILMFKTGFPLLITSILMMVQSQLDIWLISFFGSEEQVAVYGAAAKLAAFIGTPLTISNFVIAPLIPELAQLQKKNIMERLVREAALITSVISFLGILLFTLFSKEILTILYGEYYIKGSTILIILGLGQLLNVGAGSSGTLLIMMGYERVVSRITFFSTGFMILVSFLLGYFMGALGIALGIVFGYLIINLIRIIVVKRNIGIWTFIDFRDIKKLIKFRNSEIIKRIF